MNVFVGESLSTFILLFLGVGLTQQSVNPSQVRVSFYWVLAVFSGSLLGNFFSSASMNPIFLLNEYINFELSSIQFLMGLLGEIIGSISAIVILLNLPSAKDKSIHSYAAVADCPNTYWVFGVEMMGTGSLLLISNWLSIIDFMPLRSLLISLYIGSLIYFIGPITGASFNPIRDLVPRFVYSIYIGSWAEFSKSLLSSSLAPLVGGILFTFLV